MSLVALGLPNNAGLFPQATTSSNATAFGDGLSCSGGGGARLGIVFANSNASICPRPGIDPLLSVQGVSPGNVRTYPLWHRDSDSAFCTSTTFNLTNALTLTWH